MHIFKAISLISAAAFASLAIATPTPIEAEAAVIPRQEEMTVVIVVANLWGVAGSVATNLTWMTDANATAENIAGVIEPVKIAIGDAIEQLGSVTALGASVEVIVPDICGMIAFLIGAFFFVVSIAANPVAVAAVFVPIVTQLVTFVQAIVFVDSSAFGPSFVAMLTVLAGFSLTLSGL